MEAFKPFIRKTPRFYRGVLRITYDLLLVTVFQVTSLLVPVRCSLSLSSSGESDDNDDSSGFRSERDSMEAVRAGPGFAPVTGSGDFSGAG